MVQPLSTEIEMAGLDQLRIHPANPRRGNLDLVKDSIRANGWYGTLIVQRSTGHILVGNHRFRAGAELGMTEFPVLYVDVDDERARRILLADNRTNDVAAYDDQALLELLQGLDGWEGTGYSADELDDLMAKLDSVQETPYEEFGGGYAVDVEGDRSVPTTGAGRAGTLREVVLLLTTEEHERFMEAVKLLQDRFGVSNTTAVVVEAVHRHASA
jgi:hypothetical protein